MPKDPYSSVLHGKAFLLQPPSRNVYHVFATTPSSTQNDRFCKEEKCSSPWTAVKEKSLTFRFHHRSQKKCEKRLIALSMFSTLASRQEIVLVSSLKDCTKRKDLQKGSIVHADCIKKGLLQANVFLGSAVVNMYAKCGKLAKGQEIFDELSVRNVVLWNTLIAAYAQHGHGQQVLLYYTKLKEDNMSPNAVTFLCVLKACGSLRTVKVGGDAHAEIMRRGLLEKEAKETTPCGALGNALVDMYAKFGVLVRAQEVFDDLPTRNVITWNSLIGGYAEHGHAYKALDRLKQMQEKGLFPNVVSFLAALKACGSTSSIREGMDIHADILRQGYLEKDVMLGNALVDMYAKCGALSKAQEVFENLPNRNVVTWNALLAGYCQHELGRKALNCFEQMQCYGPYPNATTFTCILQACGSVRDGEKGKKIHDEIVRQGLLLEEDCVLCTALVDMYIKCGKLSRAQELFDEFGGNDVISWTSLISGYCQHGYAKEALNCLDKMKHKGFYPDSVTFPCILKACSTLGAANKGEVVHAEIVSDGLSGKNGELASVWTALVDMYVKCGELGKAQEVFDRLPIHDVFTWTVLMAGHAQAGKHSFVFELFDNMLSNGIEPNSITFSIVLNTCSYSGLVNEGWTYFHRMWTGFSICPTPEHCIYMIELFVHAGFFDKAVEAVWEMQSSTHLGVWFALLCACQQLGNVKLASLAFDHAVQIDENCLEAYVYMAKICTNAGMKRDADRIKLIQSKNKNYKYQEVVS